MEFPTTKRRRLCESNVDRLQFTLRGDKHREFSWKRKKGMMWTKERPNDDDDDDQRISFLAIRSRILLVIFTWSINIYWHWKVIFQSF